VTTDPDLDASDLPALRSYLVAHAIPGVDEVLTRPDGSTEHRRDTGTGDGVARVVVTLPWADVGAPVVRAEGPPDAVAPDRAAVRRWLGLDIDPGSAASALAADPVLGPLVRARPRLRVPGAANPFESAVFVILGQHVSLAAGRAFAGRLVASYGGFPTPAALARADPELLQRSVGVTGARARTIVELARAVAAGILPLSPPTVPGSAQARDGLRARLLDLPGVGPWTADLIALRCLRDPDVFLPGDLVLRKALGGVGAAEAAGIAQAWRPHRSTAVLHLWTQHALVRPG